MEKQFAKNSQERQLFADFYKMCEKFWEPENTDEYWTEVSKAADWFIQKYGKVHPIAKEMTVAFVCGLDEKFRREKK